VRVKFSLKEREKKRGGCGKIAGFCTKNKKPKPKLNEGKSGAQRQKKIM